ncbi:hypothetical protein PQQ52_02360 [Paraburkholderia sediminicola]|uniref:hypothetical protein n=1 Tax=Paraburkholderia sediminicola TaxID=458836 RepID=UPI0038BD77F4
MAVENFSNLTTNDYCIDVDILLDLLHEIDPSVDDRPDRETFTAVSQIQPGLEMIVAGFQHASRSRLARLQALRILYALANNLQPSWQPRQPHLRALVDGYRLATVTAIGASVAPVFVAHMLEGDDAL